LDYYIAFWVCGIGFESASSSIVCIKEFSQIPNLISIPIGQNTSLISILIFLLKNLLEKERVREIN